jgi:hypothetical protein
LPLNQLPPNITGAATGQVGVVNGVINNPVIDRLGLCNRVFDTANNTFTNLVGEAVIGD